MGQIRVTSGTDLAVRFILMFLALLVIGLLVAVVAPAVQYVFSNSGVKTSTASFIVAIALFCCCIALIPGDADENMAALSTLVYVLEVHKIVLNWGDAVAVANLFSNNAYSTWYPLKDIAKLPRAERRDAIVHVAKTVGRFIEPPSQADKERDFTKRKTILIATCVAWIAFLGVGAAQQGGSFDLGGFVGMGVVPAIIPLAALFVLRAIAKRKHESNVL